MHVKQTLEDLKILLSDLEQGMPCEPSRHYDDRRTWSYGDVENNGVYYHPQLTHYAHQAFEQFFFKECGIHYADLSGKEAWNLQARQNHEPKIERMTFPVGVLHQVMLKPMYAGNVYQSWIDTVDLPDDRVGVRAHVFSEKHEWAAIVIWVRWARLLDPERKTVPIPEWFPKRRRQ